MRRLKMVNSMNQRPCLLGMSKLH